MPQPRVGAQRKGAGQLTSQQEAETLNRNQQHYREQQTSNGNQVHKESLDDNFNEGVSKVRVDNNNGANTLTNMPNTESSNNQNGSQRNQNLGNISWTNKDQPK